MCFFNVVTSLHFPRWPPHPQTGCVRSQTEHEGGGAEERGKGGLCPVPRSPRVGHGCLQTVLLPGLSREPSWNGSRLADTLCSWWCSATLKLAHWPYFFEGFLQTTQNVSFSFSWFLMQLCRDGVENDRCIQEGFVWRMIWGWFLWKPLKRNLVLLENEKKKKIQLAWVMLLFWCFLFKKSQHRQKPVRLDKTGSLHFLATRSSPSWC